jgi:SNF2 family DNA or RNA helicase
VWNREVARRIARGDTSGINRLKALMKTICLRRTKETKFGDKPILSLPDRESIVVKLDWKYENEKKMYNAFQDGMTVFLFTHRVYSKVQRICNR